MNAALPRRRTKWIGWEADRRRDEGRILLGVEGCLPTANGARVRQTNGKVSVTDGPFTESKEVVGGSAILQASSKAEAIELTRQFLKVAGDGECEPRELYDADPSAASR